MSYTDVIILFILLAILCTSVLFVAYLSSSIGKDFKKIKKQKSDLESKISEMAVKSKIMFEEEKDAEKFINNFFAVSILPLSKKILIAFNSPSCRSAIYSFENLINVELEIDGKAITSPSLSGAAIGGLIFGGAGAIVGGLYKTEKKKIENVSIKLCFDDLKFPFRELDFLKSSIGFYLYEEALIEILKEAKIWHGRFLTILETNKRTYSADKNHTQNLENFSKADEFIKLKRLLDDGSISQSEFEKLKSKLIN